MYNYILALAILTGNEDVADKADMFSNLKDAIVNVAVERELLDTRNETRFMLKNWNCFQADIDMIRQRYIELKDAPFVEDARRFPNKEYINELISFNRAFKANLEEYANCHNARRDEYSLVIKETERLYLLYDVVRDAQSDYYYVTVRRTALLKLKGIIGNEAYYSGELPPHVPVWRFREVR